MRHDRLYLEDIIEAADDVGSFIDQVTREEFMQSDLLKSGVLYKLLLMGEAASRLSGELREKYPDVPWSDIVAFRNFAVHEYFAVDWSIVWFTATQDAPGLREMIVSILSSEFQD